MFAHPLVADRAKGSRLWDIDGNEYVDLLMGAGPLILGHAPDVVAEAVVAQIHKGTHFAVSCELESIASKALVDLVPCLELVRFNCSGSEAVHNCLRVARAFTGRSKVVKFEGHFHGTVDDVYVSVRPPFAAGLPHAPWPIRQNAGQPQNVTENIIVLPWNDVQALERTLRFRAHEVAAVVTEPVMYNNAGILPEEGYLSAIREITQRYEVLLVFDEIITGFRLALGGAQQFYGVTPDLCMLGKALGAGYPISAFGGRRDIMEIAAATHYGTFNANPMCLAAVVATLEELSRDDSAALRHTHEVGERLRDGLNRLFSAHDFPMQAHGNGAVFFVTSPPLVLRDYRDVLNLDNSAMHKFHAEMMSRGVLFVPNGRMMLSTAHGDNDVDTVLAAAEDVIGKW
ncbi:MAG: aspartate aminotransferase family protein [Thermoleophilia bacterium]|nr:aspartate aminotransferase family protein [Thermoleophilia bacterium]